MPSRSQSGSPDEYLGLRKIYVNRSRRFHRIVGMRNSSTGARMNTVADSNIYRRPTAHSALMKAPQRDGTPRSACSKDDNLLGFLHGAAERLHRSGKRSYFDTGVPPSPFVGLFFFTDLSGFALECMEVIFIRSRVGSSADEHR